MNNLGRAILLITLSIFLFDIQGAIIKHLGDRYSIPQIATFRNLFGLIPSLIAMYWMTHWPDGKVSYRLKNWPLAILRGLCIFTAQFFFYWSLTIMALATATTLAFAGPLFITTLSVPLLKHHISMIRWIAVSVGFIGIVLVMRPGADVFELKALLPVIAAFGYGLSSVLVRLFDDSASTAVINIYTTLTTLVCSVILMFLLDGYSHITSIFDWLWLIGMGGVGGFAVLFMIMAYRLTRPSNLSPFEYFGIPFSFAIGFIFFDESPFGTLFPGVLFIVAGGLLIVWRERHHNNNDS